LGTAGERAASKHLRRHGLKILARNVRVSRRGEIDLIARDRDTLVFVEVKTRRYGDPRDAVNSEKRRRMTHAAAEFRKRYEVENVPCRFDVVAIVWPENEKRPLIEYYPNAFTAGD
jgi:putative endonuclease